jgi:hypothetical protein
MTSRRLSIGSSTTATVSSPLDNFTNNSFPDLLHPNEAPCETEPTEEQQRIEFGNGNNSSNNSSSFSAADALLFSEEAADGDNNHRRDNGNRNDGCDNNNTVVDGGGYSNRQFLNSVQQVLLQQREEEEDAKHFLKTKRPTDSPAWHKASIIDKKIGFQETGAPPRGMNSLTGTVLLGRGGGIYLTKPGTDDESGSSTTSGETDLETEPNDGNDRSSPSNTCSFWSVCYGSTPPPCASALSSLVTRPPPTKSW